MNVPSAIVRENEFHIPFLEVANWKGIPYNTKFYFVVFFILFDHQTGDQS